MYVKRYKKNNIRFNDSDLIKKILDYKNISNVLHYRTSPIKLPTDEEKIKIKTISIVWKRGDRLFKYAEEYYQNPELWWIIGMYNNKPTDAHFSIGDIVYIPVDLNNLFEYVEI